jgi:hypothetical protein
MENFESDNSPLSNDTPRLLDFKKPPAKFIKVDRKCVEMSLSEPDYSMRRTLD